MLPPRIRVKELHVITADSPQELVEKVNAELEKFEPQGLPMFQNGQWVQFLVETVIVMPRAMAEQSGIVPVQKKFQGGLITG